MKERLDLETAIYRILFDEEGISQSSLFEKLEQYVKRLEKMDIILNVDKGNLSKKLKSLEKKGIIFHESKKMEDRDQEAYAYYIRKDLPTFEYIIKHLANNIDTALDISPLNRRDLKKYREIKDDKPRDLTLDTKCKIINALIKSAYMREIIGTLGFESMYQIYKKEVDIFCELNVFIELAISLINDGLINNIDEFGSEFKKDAELCLLFYHMYKF